MNSCYNCEMIRKYKGQLNYVKCEFLNQTFTIFESKNQICSKHKKRD